MQKKYFLTMIIICLFLLVVACTQKIEEIKNQEHVGKTVAVKGTVKNTIKIGSLSGYTLEQKDGESIKVSSESLPEEGSTRTVNGVLMKDTLFGYYIKENE